MTNSWVEAIRNPFSRMLQQAHRRRLLTWLLAGLLLRLLIMPFFTHADFLSEYRRVYMTIDTGHFFPQYTRLVVYYIELFFLALSLPVLPTAESVFYFTDLAHSTAGLPDFFLFVSDPLVFRTLFLLKIPYLLCDMGTAVLVARMMEGRPRQLLAVNLWLFNPVTLYAFYLFGRFESIPIFFLAMTLRFVQKDRFLAAAAAFGLALNCREINLIFVPVFFLSLIDFHRSWKRNVGRILPAAGIVAGLYLLPQIAARILDLTPLFYGKTTLQTDRAGHLLDFRTHWLLPFIFSYFLTCLWLLENRKEPFFRLAASWSLCIVSFFFFTRHSAHYVSWLMLFPVLMLYFDREMLLPLVLVCASWVGLWLFATDAGVFTLLLASPLSIQFSGLPTVPQLYAEIVAPKTFFDLGIVVLILNNLYHACLAFLAFKLFSRPRS